MHFHIYCCFVIRDLKDSNFPYNPDKNLSSILVYDNGEPHNIYNIVEISPETLRYIRLFAMAGSIYVGYENSSHPSKEYYIVDDIPAA